MHLVNNVKWERWQTTTQACPRTDTRMHTTQKHREKQKQRFISEKNQIQKWIHMKKQNLVHRITLTFYKKDVLNDEKS